MSWRSSGRRGEEKGWSCAEEDSDKHKHTKPLVFGDWYLWAVGLGGEICSGLDTGRFVD